MDPSNSNDDYSSRNSSDEMASDDDSIKSESQPYSKRRKHENSSWSGKGKNSFALLVHYNEADDKNCAHCKYCGKTIRCASSKGTAPLKNHIRKCKKLSAIKDKKEKMLVAYDEDVLETNPVPVGWRFNQEAARKTLIEAIIVEELPFDLVDGAVFHHLMKALNPEYVVPSRSDVIRDCYALFLRERKRLKDALRKLSSRVSLTTDAWTCDQGFDYMCLIAHYIDDDWVLHKKIINFRPLGSYNGDWIAAIVRKCLADWGIKEIMAVTVDNISCDEFDIDYLRRRLNNLESIFLNGKYSHLRCVVHMLNTIVKDGLKEMEDSISKVRDLVRYVRNSSEGRKRFKACVEEEGLGRNSSLYLDIEPRWDTTFLMLQSALKFKKAFDNLLMKDCSCIEEIIIGLGMSGGVPKEEDWTKISSFLPIFKVLRDATSVLSSSCHVTCNDHVHDVFAIGLAISNCCKHEDEGCQKMAQQIKLKYEKYWSDVSNINYLLFIALLLDPRRKMKYVNWLVSDNFDDTKAEILVLGVKMHISELYEWYASSMPLVDVVEESASSLASSSNKNLNAGGKRQIIDFAKLLLEKFEMETGTNENKTELDKYLEDPCESDVSGFSTLHWWKKHQKRYPILSRMARDVLAVPISAVASESAFDTRGSVLSSFRSSLTPRVVEVLICAKSWLLSTKAPATVEDNFIPLEQIEAGMKDLAMEHYDMLMDESLVGDWGE